MEGLDEESRPGQDDEGSLAVGWALRAVGNLLRNCQAGWLLILGRKGRRAEEERCREEQRLEDTQGDLRVDKAWRVKERSREESGR